MTITGTHFNYYQLCHRKLWLFANGINMEQESDLVYEGKLIHQESYPQRSSKYEEVEIDGIKVDYYDAKHKVIHEIKKSNKVDKAHEWQLKYYMYVFEQHGVEGVKGLLEYPEMRKTEEVILSDADREEIRKMMTEISDIIGHEGCPSRVKKGICKNCSYYEFCYSDEPDMNKDNEEGKK
ncbi:CRISPR-associated protein Cas4 [Hallella multisaccharivorax DSM 17128]|uniref:CRISPR-associated exonuclease Cas4 n=1 Tax=Hallella multisaccharivorax DSM 17128 TaxID=688246 RepID=F8N7X0_9BACT|nr:CRISPR-associated protein Cas4 [Hallella multisaccharivorax]EGN57516.1 CRISPR-associated exonuclease, Cas4 family [Hallella multisaccharivorax DSM 17128]GJG31229.1 CRISPR-associated protein Cas4 [Hallella multisaccharivorax DSM 17128]